MTPKTTFFKPQNLELRDFQSHLKPGSLDKYHYVLDNVYLRRVISRREKTDYINLSSVILQKVLGARYAKPIIGNLLSWGVLECDGTFSKGKKSLGYRFTKSWREAKFAATPVNKPSFARHVAKIRAKSIQAAISVNPGVFGPIFKTLETLTIDHSAAFSFAVTHHGGEPLEVRLRAIEKIRDREWFFSHDRQEARLFHNLVQLSRDIRQFAALGGKPIVQLDFSSFQPALLASFYPADSTERAEYIRDLAGDFYAPFNNLNMERGDLKRAVFSDYLFTATNQQSAIRDIFEARYPELSRIIFNVKGGEKGKFNRKDLYARLPLQLQKQEAEFMFNVVVPRLLAINPEMPVITLHDCIATTPEFAQIVTKVMKEAFAEKFGFLIPVK